MYSDLLRTYYATMLQTSTDIIVFKSHNNLINEASLVLFYKGVYKGLQNLGNYPRLYA